MQNVQHPAASNNGNVANIVPATPANLAKHGIPMLVPRVDLLGTKILVLANSLDTEADTIQYYDLKKGNKPNTVSSAYYRSTKKLEDTADIMKLVNEFTKATGAKEIILRERLVKISPSLDRDETGSVSAEALNEWKAKFLAAVTKLINEM